LSVSVDNNASTAVTTVCPDAPPDHFVVPEEIVVTHSVEAHNAMVWTQAATEATVSAGICLALIFVRCGYRMLRNCKVHTTCHRTWHADDAWMAFSLIPLAARSVTIALSFSLAEKSKNHHDYVVSRKLLIVSRLTYAFLCVLLFLFCPVSVISIGICGKN
jgi:hypothetical protein